MPHTLARRFRSSFLTAVVVSLAGCGSTSDGAVFTSGGHTGTGGSAGSGGSGGGILGDDDGGGSGGGGDLTDGGACAATSTKGQLTPLDLMIMLDQSGSMKETPTGTISKWSAVVQGLSAFVNDPAASGIGVGLQYFGQPKAGGGGGFGGSKDSCNVADYATASVPIADLPGNAGAITTSLGQHGPSTSTPSAVALQGVLQYAGQWQTSHPDHTVAVIFATDGDPTECPPFDNGTMGNIAATAANANPSIKTYVIGMAGATTGNLDAWAAAGGTGQSYDASDPSKFVSALNAIRGTALTCEYQIPAPEAGTLDYGLVNVQFTANGNASTVLQVSDASACDPTAGGWYYDDPNAPKHIELCPVTCTTVKAAGADTSANAEVDVLLGCATQTGGVH